MGRFSGQPANNRFKTYRDGDHCMSQNPCPSCATDRAGLEVSCPRCGWRPVEPKSLPTGDPVESSSEASRVGSLWWACAIAPLAAPVLFAMLFFIFGIVALAASPDHTGTPIAVLFVPALSLTAGVVASYLAAGVFGMPMVLWLEKRKMLNGYTIHGAALACSMILITLSCGLLYALSPRPGAIGQLVFFGAAVFVFTAPCVLASATTFWWVSSRGFRGMSLRALMWTITAIAFLLGAATPLLRQIF